MALAEIACILSFLEDDLNIFINGNKSTERNSFIVWLSELFKLLLNNSFSFSKNLYTLCHNIHFLVSLEFPPSHSIIDK